jgi:formate-nitrite transporter family protein
MKKGEGKDGHTGRRVVQESDPTNQEAEGGKVPIIIIITYLISIGQFNHIIAGSVDTFYLVVIGTRTIGDYFLSFALPTLLGNILGGVSLVALLGHAQVHS